jgi:hypothetical protein
VKKATSETSEKIYCLTWSWCKNGDNDEPNGKDTPANAFVPM